jgi:serine/threonine protein kinase
MTPVEEVPQQGDAGTGAPPGAAAAAAGGGPAEERPQQLQQPRPLDRHPPPGTAAVAAAERVMRQRAEEFVREVAVMKKLSHPNVVKLVEVIDDPGEGGRDRGQHGWLHLGMRVYGIQRCNSIACSNRR